MEGLDFAMRRIMDQKLSEIGTGATGEFRSMTLQYAPVATADLHLTSGSSTLSLDTSKVWVQGSLTRIPTDIITRGFTGRVEKNGLYVVHIKSDKDLHEYTNEAISVEVEKHFKLNTKITLDGVLLTIGKAYQQPSIFLEGSTGRYWNRVFIECVIYDQFN